MIVKLKMEATGIAVLVRNKSRSIMQTFPVTESLKAMFGGRSKIYCRARIVANLLVIGEKVEDQNW